MKFLTTTALSLSFVAIAGCAQAGPTSQLDKTEVEEIVRAYLLENPEIIREALIELEKKEDRASITAVADSLYKDPRDASFGPKNAKVTIVEFFDYNCGYCKQSTEWVKEIMEKHPKDVRIIFKELPILDGRSKTSRNAAKAALAASEQGKYTEMHFALMSERSLTHERVEKIATDVGLDMEKFRKDMADEKLEVQLDDTLILAQRIPSLTGTPYFLINDDYMAGADVNRLQAMLDDALGG